MSLAPQGDLEFLLPPSELMATVSDLEPVLPFRLAWGYSNWGYSVAGAIIERLSSRRFYGYVKEVILDPLNLVNTTSQPAFDHGDDANFAEAYTALRDSTPYPLPRRYPFKYRIFGSAGGMYSSVNDLLTYAKAVLGAEKDSAGGLLTNISMLLSNQVPLDGPFPRDYHFYGMGWIRTQLPGVVGLQGDNAELFDWDNKLPILGPKTTTMMTYYHQGESVHDHQSGVIPFLVG